MVDILVRLREATRCAVKLDGELVFGHVNLWHQDLWKLAFKAREDKLEKC